MKKLVITFAMISVLGAGLASAGERVFHRPAGKVPIAEPAGIACFSYDYIDLNYIYDDIDNSLFDRGHRYGIDFSKSIGNLFYLSAGYERSEYDYDLHNINQFMDYESNRYRLGVGIRHTLFNCVDLTLEGGATHTDVEVRNFSQYDNDYWGWYIAPGFRAMVTNNLELYGRAFYHDEEGYQHWRFTPGLVYNVNQMIGLKVGGEFDDGDRALVLGVRVNY